MVDNGVLENSSFMQKVSCILNETRFQKFIRDYSVVIHEIEKMRINGVSENIIQKKVFHFLNDLNACFQDVIEDLCCLFERDADLATAVKRFRKNKK